MIVLKTHSSRVICEKSYFKEEKKFNVFAVTCNNSLIYIRLHGEFVYNVEQDDYELGSHSSCYFLCLDVRSPGKKSCKCFKSKSTRHFFCVPVCIL